MIIFRSAGESHGKGLLVLIENLPAGLEVEKEKIDLELARRQKGYGRGGRMAIETDSVEIIAGVRWGKTTGAPVAMLIKNRDFENWREAMSPEGCHEGAIGSLTEVRPGHADLPGALKYGHRDARNILERSSARETASRVAAGAVAKALLKVFDIQIGSFVTSIGAAKLKWNAEEICGLGEKANESGLRIPDSGVEKEAVKLIDEAKKKGDTLGGTFVVFAEGVPVGLGSHVSHERRIDGQIARAI
ncbi:chorismate synthase, partial [bacterium]